jgi:hypothetical protein
MNTHIRMSLALALAIALTSAPLFAQTANPPTQQTENLGEEAGYGAGSVLANLFYMPAKVTYAGLGLLTGGLGYVLSGGRADVANNIIYPAIKGHYVVTPSQLKGTEPIYFVGAPPPEPEPRVDAAPTASSAVR